MKITNQGNTVLMAKESNAGSWFGVVVILLFAFAYFLLAKHSSQPLAIWIGFVPVAVAVLIILFHKSVTMVFDKGSGQATLSVHRLFGGKKQVYSLDQIDRIQLVSSWAGTNGQAITRLLVLLKDTTTIDLSDKQRSSVSVNGMPVTGVIGTPPNLKNGQMIAEFLGVPFEPIGTNNAFQAIGQVFQTINNSQQASTTPPAEPPVAHPGQADQAGFAMPRDDEQDSRQ